MKIYDILGVQEEQAFSYEGKVYKFIEGQRYILSSDGKWYKEFNERCLIDMIEHSDEIKKYYSEKSLTLINSKITEGYLYARRIGDAVYIKKDETYNYVIYTNAWKDILPDCDGKWIYLPNLIKSQERDVWNEK